MSETSPDLNSAKQRHWLYGFNAVMLVVIGAVVLSLLFWVGDWTKAQTWGTYDWTGSGANSLSPRTQLLLKEIGDRNESFKIYSLFPSRSDIEKRENKNVEQDERRQQVLDVLQQYARRSPHVAIQDFGDRPTEDIKSEISSLYANDLAPYKDMVMGFDPLVADLKDFVDLQGTKVAAAVQKGQPTKEELETAGDIEAMFKSVPEALDTLRQLVDKERNRDYPSWTSIRTMIQNGDSDIPLPGLGDQRFLVGLFTLMSDKDQIKSKKMPPAIEAFFLDQSAQYKAKLDELNAFMKKVNDLKPLKVDEALSELARNTIVVIGKDNAKILSPSDIYQTSGGQSGTPPTPVFNGEQAVSSALLAMVRPEKVKVVFVGAGSSGNSAIKEVLKAENFDTYDWSPPAPNSPPSDNPEPPAEGRGVVWVVYPPAPDPQMMQMGMNMPGDPKAILDATKKHMADGGQVLFLAEATAPNPMGPAASGFPYADLIKDFGIDVQARFTVLSERDGRDPNTGEDVRRVFPMTIVNRFDDNEITTPVQSLDTVFAPVYQQDAGPTVVSLHQPMPDGAEGHILARATDSNSWATPNPSQDAKFNPQEDLKGDRVTLAAIATRNKGKKDAKGASQEQRIAVIGAKSIAADQFLEYSHIVMEGNQLVQESDFPGNGEFVKNTVLWLAGYENMIAVSAKTNQVARIGDIKPASLAWIRGLVAAGVPLLALGIGAFVYLIRRR